MYKILMSIKPQWFGKIFFGGESGKKTIEVRKSRPILEPPFKVFVYCTKRKGRSFIDDTLNLVYGNKILGSFVCDKIEKIDLQAPCAATLSEMWTFNRIAKQACLTVEQLKEYLSGNIGYGWRITEPKLFDEPKELGEFGKYKTEWVALFNSDNTDFYPLTRPPQSWCYVEERRQ